MSAYKNLPNGKTVRRNEIPRGQQWAWWTIEMLESPAYRVLSLSAHRVIARIRIELAHHGGRDNGELPVTFDDFERYGIHRHAIAPAIREAEALGFIRTTQLGRAGNGEFRIPNKFALTHLAIENGQKVATNDWHRIETLEEAMALSAAARKAPPRFGKISWRKKQNAGDGIRTSVGDGNSTSNGELPVSKNAPLSSAETALLSISRGGGRGSGGKSTLKPEAAEEPMLSTQSEAAKRTLQ